MWDITADEARKLSEVILLVLPLLALADLVESGAELGRPSLRALHRFDEGHEGELERDNELQALGKAVIFYCGFVVSAALGMVGLLIAPPAGFLVGQLTVFFLTAWCLFSQIGNKFLIDLARIYRDSGGPELIEPGSRFNLRNLMAVRRGHTAHPASPAGIDGRTAKAWRHRRRVAAAGMVTIPTLTFAFALFVVGLDILLCTSARVIGS